jgi:hypothetical protein
MSPQQGMPHSKLPPDAKLFTRDTNAPIKAEDTDYSDPAFIIQGLARLREALGELARQTENRGNPVDEYNTTPITGAATESTVTVLPTYEYMPEKIEAVIIAGPPAAAVTLILGDRQWSLVIPAAGILPIGPLAIILGRNDPRQLVAQTPGQYFLEVMGIADRRFRI